MKQRSQRYRQIAIGNFLLLLDIRMNSMHSMHFLDVKTLKFYRLLTNQIGPIQRSKLLSERPFRLGYSSELPALTQSQCKKKCHDLF